MTSARMVISCWLVGLVGKLRASCGCMAVRWVTGWVAGWLAECWSLLPGEGDTPKSARSLSHPQPAHFSDL